MVIILYKNNKQMHKLKKSTHDMHVSHDWDIGILEEFNDNMEQKAEITNVGRQRNQLENKTDHISKENLKTVVKIYEENTK